MCLELSVEWTDVRDASRKEEEGQVELGVALLGLCLLQNSMENPGAPCPVQLKSKCVRKHRWGPGPLRGTPAAGPASLWSSGLFIISVILNSVPAGY